MSTATHPEAPGSSATPGDRLAVEVLEAAQVDGAGLARAFAAQD